jgi:hypothetical protein
MRSRMLAAWLVGGIGVVFLGQGLGLIPGSVMTGDPFWAVVGAVMVVGAGVVVWQARRQR